VLLLIFESIGAPELLVILVVALIIFGPRKLPQLSRSLGKSLAEFRRHSDEFKRTWEREVEIETTEKDARIAQAMLPEDNSILGPGRERSHAVMDAANASDMTEPRRASSHSPASEAVAVEAAASQPAAEEAVATADDDAAPTPEPTRKRDWL
jgi:sec-independent protein translocase protein TatB